MNEARDKYLTDILQKVGWKNLGLRGGMNEMPINVCLHDAVGPIDFSKWETFGILWEWSINQDDWFGFLKFLTTVVHPDDQYPIDMNYIHVQHINPDRFANATFEWLKSKDFSGSKYRPHSF